ncbi:MAG: DUF4384 domain-containing protein [Gemmatimonadales bacterium]|jgi:hypothetical protein
MLVASLLLALPLLAAPAGAGTTRRAAPVPPGIRLWTSHSDTYHRGEPVRIYFRTERDAYVTIFRVDTDGRLRVLFPREPSEPNLAHGGETYDVAGVDDHDAFYVDDYPGVGYVFGVASQDPFDYGQLAENEQWDFQAAQNLTDGRLHGDPYASLQQVVQQIEPEGYADYDTHLLPYYVEQRYDYPRFLCYDCHAYTPFAYWNPYAAFCSRYSLFVYYDPFYFYPSYWYPTRYYGGTAVVYVRPRFGGSQYVFREPGDRSAPSVVYRDRRNTGFPSTPADRGVRAADLGGVGSVPAPVGGGGRRMVGGIGGLQSPGGMPVQRQPGGEGASQAPGRRYAPVTDLGVIGPSAPQAGTSKSQAAPGAGRRYIGESAQPSSGGGAQASPEAPRGRGVYIEPGYRAAPQSGAQAPAAAAGRYAEPRSGPEVRGQGQPAPRSEPRNAPSAPRSEPRAQPRGESRPAGRSGGTPTLIRRRP